MPLHSLPESICSAQLCDNNSFATGSLSQAYFLMDLSWLALPDKDRQAASRLSWLMLGGQARSFMDFFALYVYPCKPSVLRSGAVGGSFSPLLSNPGVPSAAATRR